MTFEELELRLERGARFGQTIDAHDAITVLIHELSRIQTTRGGEAESTEQAWEHTGEAYQKPPRA